LWEWWAIHRPSQGIVRNDLRRVNCRSREPAQKEMEEASKDFLPFNPDEIVE
jgi:hypothetical protein